MDFTFGDYEINYLQVLFYASNDWKNYIKTLSIYDGFQIRDADGMRRAYPQAKAHYNLNNCKEFKKYYNRLSEKTRRKNRDFKKFNKDCNE